MPAQAARRAEETARYTVTAEYMPPERDGHRPIRVHVLDTKWPRSKFNPHPYTTVRNIDGSNHFMCDLSYWSFLPHDHDLRRAVDAAVADLKARDEQPADLAP